MIFRSSYTEKTFNEAKVRDNFQSLLIGLLNDSERRDEFNDQILTIFSFGYFQRVERQFRISVE